MSKHEEKAGPQRPGRALVTLPTELRAALDREAYAHGRTLTSEIVRRLEESFQRGTSFAAPRIAAAVAAEERGEYSIGAEISPLEAGLLEVFRKLPMEKRLALLALLQ
jgi:hypothetical protein